MTKTERNIKPIIRDEEFAAFLQEIDDLSSRRVDALRSKQKGRVFRSNPRKANIDEFVSERMRQVLEDELVPAKPVEGARLDEAEVNRETIKKALVRLKADRLRQVARASEVDVGGNLIDLAERIGWHYRWDDEAIARLILEYEPEPRVERAHSDRLFPLLEVPDLDYVDRRLDYVHGRYIRVGLARWFVFQEHRRD